MNELNFLAATTMAQQVKQKKISPVDLIEAHLLQIEKLNPTLNAYVQVDTDGARAHAHRAHEMIVRDEALGPLHGVPVSIKSSIAVSGMLCETGTRLRAGLKASDDAVLVKRLRAAGAIILGVTNTPEFLMAWETDNLLHGRTNNPWDLTRTAGGSSGGEAASISAGCSAGGVGSDGGGSIRVPAHFSGICGLKPTPGRIPATGHFPVSVGPFALLGVVGPMARTVADLQLLFETMAGPDDGDTCSAPVPIRKITRDELKKTRIGYFQEDGRTPVAPEVAAAVREAADALSRAGFDVRPFRPAGLERARQLWWKLFGTAGGMLLAPMTRGKEADLSPAFREYMGWATADRPHSGQSLLDTWVQRDEVRAKFLEETREVPIILCPPAAIPAFRHGEREWNVGGTTVRYLDAWSYAEWFNLIGNPGAVVPVNSSPEGLPVGVQVVGRPWEEELVLAVAGEIERECRGWRRPPIS
jgi:Asp-tRNA(Asn)/Glu-tRNA(Gln) amidotransferase A subunit family amidase